MDLLRMALGSGMNCESAERARVRLLFKGHSDQVPFDDSQKNRARLRRVRVNVVKR